MKITQELIDKYSAGILNSNTSKTYRLSINKFSQYLQENNITDLNQENIQTIIHDYKAYLKQKNYKAATINQYLIILKSFINDYTTIQYNKNLKLIKTPKRTPQLPHKRTNKNNTTIHRQQNRRTNNQTTLQHRTKNKRSTKPNQTTTHKNRQRRKRNNNNHGKKQQTKNNSNKQNTNKTTKTILPKKQEIHIRIRKKTRRAHQHKKHTIPIQKASTKN